MFTSVGDAAVNLEFFFAVEFSDGLGADDPFFMTELELLVVLERVAAGSGFLLPSWEQQVEEEIAKLSPLHFPALVLLLLLLLLLLLSPPLFASSAAVCSMASGFWFSAPLALALALAMAGGGDWLFFP